MVISYKDPEHLVTGSLHLEVTEVYGKGLVVSGSPGSSLHQDQSSQMRGLTVTTCQENQQARIWRVLEDPNLLFGNFWTDNF